MIRIQNPHARRKSHLKQYGMTQIDFEMMLADQRDMCAICSNPETGVKRLSVDHDHDTGKVRGLLCGRCNRGISMFLDDPYRLLSAAAYIERANGTRTD